ncbi:MAG: hypothetical protein ABF326_11105, partial [Arenicellales bacterium]
CSPHLFYGSFNHGGFLTNNYILEKSLKKTHNTLQKQHWRASWPKVQNWQLDQHLPFLINLRHGKNVPVWPRLE